MMTDLVSFDIDRFSMFYSNIWFLDMCTQVIFSVLSLSGQAKMPKVLQGHKHRVTTGQNLGESLALLQNPAVEDSKNPSEKQIS